MISDKATAFAAETLRRLMKDPKMRKKALDVAGDLAAWIAKSSWSRSRKQRALRLLAEELARQTEGGQLSYGTVLGEGSHTVVWSDGTPIKAFPTFKGDLKKELSTFRRDTLVSPPAPTERAGRLRWPRRNGSAEGDETARTDHRPASATGDGTVSGARGERREHQPARPRTRLRSR